MKQREFLAEVGTQFIALTGGRAGLEARTDDTVPLGILVLACTLKNETVRVRGSAFDPPARVTASSLAVQITFLFDRRPTGDASTAATDLPMQHYVELEQLAAERVRRYGADVLVSLASDLRLPEALRSYEARRE